MGRHRIREMSTMLKVLGQCLRSYGWGRLGGAICGALLPLDNGPRDIRALDGLRAVAALTIVV
jgi:hypothetical protein